MSEFVTLECKYCGNADRSTFIIRESEYICKCCGRCYRESASGGETRSIIGFETLKNYDFAAAENIFSEIIADYPESIDARWGLLLARYGIVFVKGFYMGEIEPIYCFPNYAYNKGSFTSEEEYKEIEKLLKSDPERMALYRKQAEQIEAAFDAFKSDVGKKEVDVFLCVKISKTTANNPHAKGTTEDYEKACELYGKLREEGKCVFFSYVTLKNTIDSDMEIWRSLLKSKKMLLIGSRTEYLNSVWVKSEWERWLWLDNAGGDEHRKNLYIYVLGSENENLYAKLPAGLKRLHPQIYTASTEADLLNDICCEEGEAEPAKTAAKPQKPATAVKKPTKTEAPKAEAKQEPETKDGYIAFLSGARETIAYGTKTLKNYSGRNDIVRVSVPSGVTAIKKSNFSDCPNLTKIQLPESITKIEKGSFAGCVKLTSVEVPAGVKEIEANTFYMCKRLASVKLHEGVTKIGDLAFSQCESLRGIALPHSLAEIGSEAFYSSGLKSVTVPQAVVSIGERAFGTCNSLTAVKLFDALTYIGAGAFDARNTLHITYSGTKEEFNSIYSHRGGFSLTCERDPAFIKHRLWVGFNIFLLAAMAIAGVIVALTVPNGMHWAIAMFSSIVVNMLVAIITHHTDDCDEYWFQFTVELLELIACLVLIIVGLAATKAVLIDAIALAVGMIIATIYIIIRDEAWYGPYFLGFAGAALLIPLAILTWSVLGLAIPLLVVGILAVVVTAIWWIVEEGLW